MKRGRPPLDLTSHPPFGRLTAVRSVGRKHGCVLWLCRCSCGATKRVTAGGLRSGGVQSCGCLRRERAGDRFRSKPVGRAAQYRALLEKGWTVARVARRFGVTPSAVRQSAKRAGHSPAAKPYRKRPG